MSSNLQFQALLEHSHMEMGTSYRIWVPNEIVETLGALTRARVIGTLNDYPYRLALHRDTAEDQFYLMIGKATRSAAKLDLHTPTRVTIAPDPEPDRLDVPEELAAALELDPIAHQKFYAITPRSQRSQSHYINTSKREETRIKRALELAEKIRTDNLYGQRKAREAQANSPEGAAW